MLQNNQINVLNTLRKCRTGKLHTGTQHMFSKAKKPPHIFLHKSQQLYCHQVCTGMPQPLFYSLCFALCFSCTTQKWNKRSKVKFRDKGNIMKTHGTKRLWKGKQKGCTVPLGTSTWRMAQDFYYFITSRSHERAGSSVLGSLLLCDFWPFIVKIFFTPPGAPPFAFAGVAQFLTAKGNMLVHGI